MFPFKWLLWNEFRVDLRRKLSVQSANDSNFNKIIVKMVKNYRTILCCDVVGWWVVSKSIETRLYKGCSENLKLFLNEQIDFVCSCQYKCSDCITGPALAFLSLNCTFLKNGNSWNLVNWSVVFNFGKIEIRRVDELNSTNKITPPILAER